MRATGAAPDAKERTGAEHAGTRPVYSIGAVARMLGVEPATLRAWEDRYGVVVPARSHGSHRLYSREQIEHLRFVVHSMGEGSSAADAHRLLAERLGRPARDDQAGRGGLPLVLLADRDRFSSELCEYYLRTAGHEVCVATSPEEAEQIAVERRPDLSVVELAMPGGRDLCRRLSRHRAPVLAVSVLAFHGEALEAGAGAFLRKPLDQVPFVSTVRDLLASAGAW